MENIIMDGKELEKHIIEAIPKILKEKFSSTYDNPLADAIKSVLVEKDSVIKDFIRDILAEMINNDELKKKISNEVVIAIVQKGIRV